MPFFLQIVIAVALAYLPFVGWMSVPWTGDQKVYLSTVIEMEQQHSLLIPYLFGEPSYYKPPLQYWSTIAGIRALGFSLWGAFIPSVLATLISALAIASVARRVLPKPEGGLSQASSRSALWFVGCLGTATFGVAAQMEIYLVAIGFTAWALALSYLERSPRDRLRNPWALYAALAAVGVLSWVKSPLYSVLWVLGYLVFLIAQREWREFRSLHFYVALIFGTLLGASWYLAVLGMDRDRFISDYILRETLSKQGGNGGTAWQLWLSVFGFSIPFVFLSFGSLLSTILNSGRRLLFFALAAGAPGAIFFSFYPYRVNTYLYVLVPIFAIAAAYFEDAHPRAAALVSRIGAAAMIVLTATLAWLSLRIGLASGWMLVAVCFLGVTGVAVWVGTLFRPKLGVWASVLFVAWLHFVGVTLGERDIQGLRDFVAVNHHRELAMLDPDRNIWHEVGLLSLALGKPVARISSAEEALDVLDAGNAVIISEDQASALLPAVRQLLDDLDDGRDVTSTPWNRFPTRKSLEVRQLIRAKSRLEMNRKFQILTLPPPSDWIMPEGGV